MKGPGGTPPSSRFVVKIRDRSVSDDQREAPVVTRSSRSRSTVAETLLAPLEWLVKKRDERDNHLVVDGDWEASQLLMLPDAVLLHLLLYVDKARVLLVCKRLCGLVLESVKALLPQHNKLESKSDVRRVCLFLEQLTRPRALPLGIVVEDYENHPLWTAPRSRFRLLICEAGDVLSRRNDDVVSEIRLVHGKFWFYCVLITGQGHRVFCTTKLSRKQAREILAVTVSRTQGDHAVAFQRLLKPEFALPDAVFGGEVRRLVDDGEDQTSLELDDLVEVDHKMGL